MGTLDQRVPTIGPLNAAQLTDEINTELAELYKRSFAKVGSAAGTNAYTGSTPLNRPLEDANGFIFVVPNANSGPCTFNGLPLVTNQGAALQAGQLSTGMVIAFIYNQPSNDYRVLTPLFGGTAPIVRVYSSPGTFIWTKPSGLVSILVEQQAPGGGGGWAVSPNSSGAGSGSFGRRLIAASLLPASVTIVNGAPGSAGTTVPGGGNNATNGGNSSFGAFITTNGGARGQVGSGSVVTGGAGGAAGTGGDINDAGRAAQSSSQSIAGAPSPSGGFGGIEGVNQATLGGGGSGSAGGNGGAGGPGRTIVTEYYS